MRQCMWNMLTHENSMRDVIENSTDPRIIRLFVYLDITPPFTFVRQPGAFKNDEYILWKTLTWVIPFDKDNPGWKQPWPVKIFNKLLLPISKTAIALLNVRPPIPVELRRNMLNVYFKDILRQDPRHPWLLNTFNRYMTCPHLRQLLELLGLHPELHLFVPK